MRCSTRAFALLAAPGLLVPSAAVRALPSATAPGQAIGSVGPVVLALPELPTGPRPDLSGPARSVGRGDSGDEVQPGHLPYPILAGELDTILGPPPAREAAKPTARGASLATGATLRSFRGQTYTTWIPPDPALAVGPRYLVEVVNSGFTIFSKDGDVDRPYTELETFFAPLYASLPAAWSASAFVFNPRVLYAPEHAKFVLFALARDDDNLRSYAFVAISTSSDPLGDWWLWAFWDPGNLDTWIESAGMSADAWGLYFTGNETFWAGGFKHAILSSVRPTIFTNSGAAGWIFSDLRWNEVGDPAASTLQPAVPYSVTADEATFFVNTFNGSGDKACLWKLTGDRGTSPTLIRNSVAVSSYSSPGLAHQPDPGADDIETFYAGALSAVLDDRDLYFSLNDAAANGSAFYVSKIDVDTLTQTRNITYASTDIYYTYPAVGLLGSGLGTDPIVAVTMSYSGDGAGLYPSGAFMLFTDFLNSSAGSFVDSGTGLSTYNRYDTDLRNRWGDYMGIAHDWSCNTIWGVTEYVSATDVWSTWIRERVGDTALPPDCDLIFDDGFELGSTANWSSQAP